MANPNSKNRKVDIAGALGASRHIHLEAGSKAQGPLGLVQLRSELALRLQSDGGRPTDPAWTVRRVVPFREAGWADLQVFAARLTAQGRSVSPAQLAALLIERGLAQLEEGVAREGDAALRTVVG